LKEALLRFSIDDPTQLLDRWADDSLEEVEFTHVEGFKTIPKISAKKREFLEATKLIVDELRPFWPLTVRQIHYKLLNNPPLTSKPRRSKYPPEKYRYRNDKPSYSALISLLTQARYKGEVSMFAIDDPTRPVVRRTGFRNASHFIKQNMDGFLTGYHRDMQRDQPRHIEVLGEKNTLLQILKPVCRELYVPLTLARGYASIPVFRDMAKRFKESGKESMSLIAVSDYDPEGFDLVDDAVRSLRDLWGVDVDYCRVGVTREQIEELELHTDFNPAKETSSRIESFKERTGGTDTWEVEALEPGYLREKVRDAIMANMDQEIYDECIAQEIRDAEELAEYRSQIVTEMGL